MKSQMPTAATLFVLLGWTPFAGAGEEDRLHPHACFSRSYDASSDWGQVIDWKKSPEAPELEVCPDPCGPECFEFTPGGMVEVCYEGSCPLSLPAPGRPVQLAMISGARDVVFEGWEQAVGFGPHRPLNYLSRARIDPDGRKVVVYFPSAQEHVAFTAIPEEKGRFKRQGGVFSIPASSIVEMDGNTLRLRLGDGRFWRYQPAAGQSAAGQPAAGQAATGQSAAGGVYDVAEMVNRHGYTIRIAYEKDRVVVTDAAGQDYAVLHTAEGLITSIRAKDREWRYAREGAFVFETAPNGARFGVSTTPGLLVEDIVRDGGAQGGQWRRFIEYDARGRMLSALDGSTPFKVHETREGGSWKVVLEKDGVFEGIERTPGSPSRRWKGADGKAAEEAV